ncbi:hypothetical protein I5T97_14170 [Serratia marcescens]|nr:hypothetical protein [Serratia marcescens]
MTWGFQTWDANGIPNNTGIVKVFTIGTIRVEQNQKAGAWSFTVPNGYKIDFMTLQEGIGFTQERRGVRVIGNNIIEMFDASGLWGSGTAPANSGWIIIYLVKE